MRLMFVHWFRIWNLVMTNISGVNTLERFTYTFSGEFRGRILILR